MKSERLNNSFNNVNPLTHKQVGELLRYVAIEIGQRRAEERRLGKRRPEQPGLTPEARDKHYGV